MVNCGRKVKSQRSKVKNKPKIQNFPSPSLPKSSLVTKKIKKTTSIEI